MQTACRRDYGKMYNVTNVHAFQHTLIVSMPGHPYGDDFVLRMLVCILNHISCSIKLPSPTFAGITSFFRIAKVKLMHDFNSNFKIQKENFQ